MNVRIYNMYPRLVGSFDKWMKEINRIAKMNFDYIYVNPFHLCGESNSDYSVKDYYRYNPLYLGKKFKSVEEEKAYGDKMLAKFCDETKKKNMNVMMDLVINHTATDSPLVVEHPEWYEHEPDGRVTNPFCMDGETKVIWTDLAEIDNLHSSKRDELWKYWLDMILHFCKLGVRGFRCDAVFMIPNELWQYIISNVKAQYPDSFFLGETLGCKPEQTLATLHAGFDMVMTAFKWWDLSSPWFLEQYNEMIKYGMTLSFPENHDTVRCASEYNGNSNFAVMKYLLSCYISKASAITTGFEYGYRRKIDVTSTDVTWNEGHYYDLSEVIANINKTKVLYKVLNNDGYLYCFPMNGLTCLVKEYEGEKALMVVNTTNNAIDVCFNPYDILHQGNLVDASVTGDKVELTYQTNLKLLPGDVKVIIGR